MPLAPNVIAVILNLLLLALTLPLAFRMVPINYLFGYRTSGSTADEKSWYAANAAFGRTAAVISAAALAAGAVMLGVRYGTDLPFWEYGFALLYIPVAPCVVCGHIAAKRALAKLAAERESAESLEKSEG